MKKKIIIWIIVLVVLSIATILYFHYAPVWASISVLISSAIGVVVGWIAHILYNKYVKN